MRLFSSYSSCLLLVFPALCLGGRHVFQDGGDHRPRGPANLGPSRVAKGRIGADDLVHWANGNVDIARSAVVADGQPLAVTCTLVLDLWPTYSSCSWSTPSGQVWTVGEGGITNDQGEVVEGVSLWEGNDLRTCGLVVNSADLSQHSGDWKCSLDLTQFDNARVSGYISTEDEVSTNLRLSEDVYAHSYNIYLEPNLGVEDPHLIQILGGVIMTLEVLQPRPCIVFQADEMTIYSVEVVNSQSGESVVPTSAGFDFQRTFVEFCVDGELSPGTYQVDVSYDVNSLRAGYYQYGLYPVACASGSEKFCWYTQGEATNARNTFPCLDEPGFKAKHRVSVARTADWHTLNNMPLINTTETSPGFFVDYFEESPDMSPYLFALAITDYASEESTVPAKVPHTIWAPAEDVAAGRAKYSADIGPRIVNFYEDYFGVDYPLPKMDYVNEINFGGAMENWGLIIFDPRTILLDQENIGDDMDYTRWIVTSVVAHELAHQWFGNIVTLNWWEQMWLNEGFATYVSYLGAEAVDPQNYPWGRMIVDETFSVMYYDSMTDQHWAMSDPVVDRPDIERKFGMFTYNKGGSVIRMMEAILGKEVLTQGLTAYLKSFSYSSTTEDDLFFYLDEAGRSAGTWPGTYPDQDKTFGDVLKTWTNQAGYPLVTAVKSCSGACEMTFSQQWFVTRGETNGEERVFDVPLSLTVADGSSDWTVNTPDLWLLDSSEMTLTMDANVNMETLVLVNTQATGYYRVNYDDATWILIGETMKQSPDAIHPFNRAKLVCDLLVLADAGVVSQDILTAVLDGYEDTDPVVEWAYAECAPGMKTVKELARLRI